METFQYHCQRLKDIPLLYTRSQFQVETEGLGQFVTSISKFFASQIEKIGHFLNPEISEYKMKADPFVQDLSKAARKVNKVMSKDFMAYKDSLIGVTQGLKVDLLTASSGLVLVLKQLDPVFFPSLQSANDKITKILASQDYATSTRPVVTNKDRDAALEAAYKLIDQCIDPNGNVDRVKLSALIPNFNVLSTIIENINTCENFGLFKDCINADKVIQTMKTRVDTLLNKIVKNKNTNISKSALSQLSLELEETAKLITMVSTLLFFKSQICSITTNIINQFA